MVSQAKYSFWLFVVVAILVSAYITNPTQEDFKQYISSGLKQEMKITNSDAASWLASALVNFAVDKGAKYLTRREDYKIFSIYYIKLPGQKNEVKVLGLFWKFIKLQ